MRKRGVVLNRTKDGKLACKFGTPWLDHFAPPVGTGKGCPACDEYQGTELPPKGGTAGRDPTAESQ